MKKYIFLFSLILSVAKVHSQAQPPQAIPYVGVANNGSIYSGQMGVKISILDGVGTVLYSEKHFPVSGTDGYYSVTIGQPSGTASLGPGVLTGTFSTIAWIQTDKFLKVELSFGGPTYTTYTQSSTVQLRSVPYALQAKSVASLPLFGIRNTIADLRATAGTANNEMVLIKGYNSAGDGGGGNFLWKTDTVFKTNGHLGRPGRFSVDNGGTIIKAGSNDNGRWIRQYDGYINVAYFGALGLGANYTLHIQNAIDFAKAALTDQIQQNFFSSNTLFIPAGNYTVDKITLKDGVSIVGDNMGNTKINASNSADLYTVDMEQGRVRINMSNLNFVGPGTGTKGCFFLEAKNETREPWVDYWTDGQISSSTFKNIQITNFKGTGMYLKDGGLNYATPIQFNTFENVRIIKGTTTEDNSYALRLDGENGQLTFINCQFDGGTGTSYSKGRNVYLKGCTSCGTKMLLPNVISFLNCTFQNGDYGAYVEYAGATTFDNCLFQSVGYGVYLDGGFRPDKGISIVNSRFINAAGYGSITPPSGYIKNGGACIKSSNSTAAITGNFIGGGAMCSSCNFIESSSTNRGLYLSGNTFSAATLNKTSGMTITLLQTSSVIDCRQQTYMSVLSNGAQIFNIDSTINAGEMLTIKSAGASPLIFNRSGNISFPGVSSSFSLATNELVTFKKTDLAGTIKYQVVSVIKNNP